MSNPVLPGGDDTSPVTPLAGRLVLGLLLLHLTLAWLLRVPGFTTGQDDAMYVLLGRALRHFSYVDLWLVGHPVESLYPPIYPAVLGLLGLLPGDPVANAIGLNLLLSTMALGVLFRIGRAWSGGLAVLALAASAVNPAMVGAAGRIGSEPLFTLLSFLALSRLLIRRPHAATLRWAGALAILAALTRSIGVVLVLATLLSWMLQRRWRAVAYFALATGLTVGPWLAWNVLAPRQLAGQSYIGDAFYSHPAGASAESPPPPAVPAPVSPPSAPRGDGPVGPLPNDSATAQAAAPVSARPSPAVELLRRVGENLPGYLTRGIPSGLALPTIPGTTLDNWGWLGLLGLFGVAGVLLLLGRAPVMGLYLAGYGALLVLWPFRLPRFLVPVLPLLILLFLLGAARFRVRRSALLLPSMFGGSLLLSSLAIDFTAWKEHRGCDRTVPYNSAACYEPGQLGFFSAVHALERIAPSDAVLLTPKAATVFYLTGHQAVNEIEAATLDGPALVGYLRDRGVQYVLLSRIHLDQWTIAAALRTVCRSFELAGEPGPDTVLLRFRPEPVTSDASCAAVDRFNAGPWPDSP